MTLGKTLTKIYYFVLTILGLVIFTLYMIVLYVAIFWIWVLTGFNLNKK